MSTYGDYDCGCHKKKDPCPKVPKDCNKFCLPCLSCTFPDIYAQVVCCVNDAAAQLVDLPGATNFDQAYAVTLSNLPTVGAPGTVTQDVFVQRTDEVLKAGKVIRDNLLAFLEKACCCIKGDDKHWAKDKDACQKERVIKAMAEIVCCYFRTAGAFTKGIFVAASTIPTGLAAPDSFEAYAARVNAATASVLADTEARLHELLRCVCGCPKPEKKHCCSGYKTEYHFD